MFKKVLPGAAKAKPLPQPPLHRPEAQASKGAASGAALNERKN